MTESFSNDQMQQIVAAVRTAVREELADAGLRLDTGDHQADAREDFRFIRRLRLSWDGAVSKIGNAVLISIIAIVGTIVSMGFWAWLSGGPK